MRAVHEARASARNGPSGILTAWLRFSRCAHHGGASKALDAYADEDAAFWAAELGRPIPAGLFGENLRTAGLDVNGAGDVVRVLSRPGHGVSIASWFTGADAAQADALEAAEAAGLLTLVPEMRESVEGVRSRGLLVLDK